MLPASAATAHPLRPQPKVAAAVGPALLLVSQSTALSAILDCAETFRQCIQRRKNGRRYILAVAGEDDDEAAAAAACTAAGSDKVTYAVVGITKTPSADDDDDEEEVTLTITTNDPGSANTVDANAKPPTTPPLPRAAPLHTVASLLSDTDLGDPAAAVEEADVAGPTDGAQVKEQRCHSDEGADKAATPVAAAAIITITDIQSPIKWRVLVAW